MCAVYRGNLSIPAPEPSLALREEAQTQVKNHHNSHGFLKYELCIFTYVDKDAKWKTRILGQIQTADPDGMGRKLRQYTIFQFRYLGIGRFLGIVTRNAIWTLVM